MKHYKISLILFVAFFCSRVQAEEFPKQLLKKYLPKNPVIVEAGGYNGADTLKMAKIWPQGTIYSFEPVPRLFGILQGTTYKCPNVTCIKKALSDRNGTFPMYVSKGGDASSSLLEPDKHLKEFTHVTFPYKINVEAITLDTWAVQNNIDHIDFLWFDLQGMEPMVLKASPIMLKTVKAIYAEVSYCELYKNAPLYPEFKVWMEQQGFTVVAEVHHHVTFGDALFVRNEIIKSLLAKK